MNDDKKNQSITLTYAVLRCPFVRNDSHQCNELCTPVGGFGVCGRKTDHQPRVDDRQPRIVFIISRGKAA
jgi:hypothetical protein